MPDPEGGNHPAPKPVIGLDNFFAHLEWLLEMQRRQAVYHERFLAWGDEIQRPRFWQR